ncbi:SIR2 family protein [Clostridium tyrobutyricum]|uniref:SIR2 family protein n=1 Tax=Clostridium tyrobutyricum TaxID=1519 RepID=UPI001C382186|nr:SIR2 family protein [Clostridium tyrobutyricum]MBV4414669.1 SIR2 family protein [Clostridium tyrobutyricum]
MSEKLVNTYIRDIANHLWNPGEYGYASLMVGAGFSKNAVSLNLDVGMPDWSELACRIYEELYPKPEINIGEWEKNKIINTSGRNVLKLAEEYSAVFGHNKLDKIVDGNISNDEYIPGRLHQDLLDLPWNDIFTTNYDTLLERTIGNYSIVYKQEDLQGSKRPRIVKVHGSIPDSKPYIITEEDYRTYPQKYAAFVNTVQQAMLETQLCLIGFSGDDPNFTKWTGWLRDNMGENCPRIYLCGVFDDFPESEKILFQNRNIIVVNLGELIESKNYSNKYQEAIKQFISEIKYIKDKIENENKIFKLPLIYIGHKKSLKEYTNLILELVKDRNKYEKYPALPHEHINNLSENLTKVFDEVLNLKENSYELIILIYELMWRIKVCCIYLTDYQAKKIEALIQKYPIEEYKDICKIFINSWIGINIFLCNIYRQNCNEDRYSKTVKMLESNISFMDKKLKSEYYIEKSKYYIQRFNYNETLECISKIPEECGEVISIEKAFLISQIGLKDDSYNLLKQVSSDISKLKCTDEYRAALMGYINLCSRTLVRNPNKKHLFSDENFKESEYNIRNILNSVKDNLMASIQGAEGKEHGKFKAFNPNTITSKNGTIPNEMKQAHEESFRYLIFLDNLCMPVYGDHKDSVLSAVKTIMKYDRASEWLYYYIIVTDDIDIYENFFKRSFIIYKEKDCCKKLYDNLMHSMNYCVENDKSVIISKKSLLDLLSRFLLVEREENITSFIKKLITSVNKVGVKNQQEIKFIESIFTRISFYLNKKIISFIIEDILSLEYLGINLSFQIFNVKVPDSDLVSEKVFDRYCDKIIDKIRNEDIHIRDDAISRMFLLRNCSGIDKRDCDISSAIWFQRDEYSFPKSNLFLYNFWIELPCPKDIEFKGLLKNYIMKFEFPSHINDNGTMSFGLGSENNIFQYVHYIYTYSLLNTGRKFKIMYDKSELNKIIEKVFKYVRKEKVIFEKNINIFGEQEDLRNTFVEVETAISVIYIEYIIKNEVDEYIDKILEEIINIFEENKIVNLPLRIIQSVIKNRDLDKKMKNELKISSTSDNWNISMLSFFSINIIMAIDYESNFKWLYGILREVFNMTPYISSERNRNIFIHVNDIIETYLSKDSSHITIIENFLAESFYVIKTRIDSMKNGDFSDSCLLDSFYDLAKLIKKYMYINRDKLQDRDKLERIVEEMKFSELPEVRNIW